MNCATFQIDPEFAGWQIYTSNFFATRGNPDAVSISRGKPNWYEGRTYDVLAPTWAMLKMSRENYNLHFGEILANLDARQVLRDLGDGAIMCCWEGFNIFCHRRFVSSWLESETGIIVPEWKHDRSESLEYDEMPAKGEGKPKKPDKPAKKLSDTMQGFLF